MFHDVRRCIRTDMYVHSWVSTKPGLWPMGHPMGYLWATPWPTLNLFTNIIVTAC